MVCVGSGVAAVADFFLGTFGKNEAEENAKAFIDQHVERNRTVVEPSKVILHKEHKDALDTVIEKAKKEGIVVNIHGLIGTGKTMTADTMVKLLEQKGVCNKAAYWYVRGDKIQGGLVDLFGGGVLSNFIKFEGETVEQGILIRGEKSMSKEITNLCLLLL